MRQVEPQFAEAERKNRLLRSVAGGGMEELPQLRTRWEKFEIMMESHQMMIRDQVCQNLTDIVNLSLSTSVLLTHTHTRRPPDAGDVF